MTLHFWSIRVLQYFYIYRLFSLNLFGVWGRTSRFMLFCAFWWYRMRKQEEKNPGKGRGWLIQSVIWGTWSLATLNPKCPPQWTAERCSATATHCSSRNSNRTKGAHCSRNSNRTNQSKKLHCGDALSLSGERSRIMGNWRIAANSSLIGSGATYRRFFGSNIILAGSSLRHSRNQTRPQIFTLAITSHSGRITNIVSM